MTRRGACFIVERPALKTGVRVHFLEAIKCAIFVGCHIPCGLPGNVYSDRKLSRQADKAFLEPSARKF
jgi:hypothetical protein